MLRRILIVILMTLAVGFSTSAQDQQTLPPAGVVNEQGGAAFVSGQVNYTFPYFRLFLPNPFVILYDVAGLVERDAQFVPGYKSQVFGAITSNPYEPPFTYELSLPAMPRGEFRDVDNDGQADRGVMVFMVALVANMWDEPFLERRDNFVAGILSSALISTDIDTFLHLEGGKLIIYAPDDQQGFPSGFGPDGQLFTKDDPVVRVPTGYTVVDVNAEPFIFERSSAPRVDLLEAEDAELADFSSLRYTQAFDAALDLLKARYAFTEYKGINWEVLRDQLRPDVVRAEQTGDLATFRRVLRDLAWSIPDGHVSGPVDFDEFQQNAAGGLGLVLRELDDGRVLVSQIIDGLPAQRAGILARAEIIAVNGVAIQDALTQIVPWTSPFSTPHNLRLEQLRFIQRGPVGTGITLTYRNPGAPGESVISLRTEFDPESYSRASFSAPMTGNELPVEFAIGRDGYGYLAIYSFSDDLPLTIQLWERAIRQAIRENLPGLIIDIRRNGGGSGYLGDQLPAYFFDDEYVIGNVARFSESRGEFVVNPALEERFIRPRSGLYYSGPIAVIVGPNCASACETFAYAMTINDRAEIIGHYPTAGLGGSVVPIAMPEGLSLSYTNTRSLGPDGEINIEGKGVSPTVRVPMTEETVFATNDVLLDAALRSLSEGSARLGITEGGEVLLGRPVTVRVEPAQRVRFDVSFRRGQVVNIIAAGVDDPTLRTVLRVYVPGNDEPVLESSQLRPGDDRSGFEALEIPATVRIIIEVATLNDQYSGTIELIVEEIND
jgi:C-terminal processing protease CtpA/Prc